MTLCSFHFYTATDFFLIGKLQTSLFWSSMSPNGLIRFFKKIYISLNLGKITFLRSKESMLSIVISYYFPDIFTLLMQSIGHWIFNICKLLYLKKDEVLESLVIPCSQDSYHPEPELLIEFSTFFSECWPDVLKIPDSLLTHSHLQMTACWFRRWVWELPTWQWRQNPYLILKSLIKSRHIGQE